MWVMEVFKKKRKIEKIQKNLQIFLFNILLQCNSIDFKIAEQTT